MTNPMTRDELAALDARAAIGNLADYGNFAAMLMHLYRTVSGGKRSIND